MAENWQSHPKLQGRIRQGSLDELQVIVHEGGPLLSKHAPELILVRVMGCAGDVYTGILLSDPAKLEYLREGSEIQFIVPAGGEYPLRVTKRYLDERPRWRMLGPCDRCGLSELFDAPSDLLDRTFSSAAGAMSMFTVTCGWCGGKQVIRLRQYGPQKWDER